MKILTLPVLESSEKSSLINVFIIWRWNQKRLNYAINRLEPTYFSWFLALFLFTAVLPAFAFTQTEIAKLQASDGTLGAFFGNSVSIDGNRMVVGARQDIGNGFASGSAYVFERDALDNWVEIAKLLASDGPIGGSFGGSVSIDGDRLVVGAKHDNNNRTYSGSAYIFERDGSGNWNESAKLLASEVDRFDDRFGTSVSIVGDRVVVGAAVDDENGNDSGSAYVFERNESGNWIEVAKLLASDGAASDLFGASVSLDDNRVVIGAYQDDDNGNNSGSAYVFERDQSGSWIEVTKFLTSDGAAGDKFGISVSLDGNRVVIGAYEDDDNGNNSGSAYVFDREESGNWVESAKILASDGAASDNFFGYSVSIDGDRVIAGAFLDNGFFSSSAYVYERVSPSNWKAVAKLLASDGMPDDSFGVSVSIEGDRAVVGALLADGNVNSSGSAYVFDLGMDSDGDTIADLVDNCPTIPNPSQGDIDNNGIGDVCDMPVEQVSLWDRAAIPATLSVSDPNAVELGVRLVSEFDGYITSILFYRGPGNNGPHSGSLWSNSGELLATVEFINETLEDGWQQANFDTPVRITAGKVYIASYFAPFGNYAVDNKFFANEGVVNRPLQLLQNGVNGDGNGVYAYSSFSTFPSETFNANNYWVDVLYTPDNIVTHTCPCSLWDDTTEPSQLMINDPNPVELGIKFTSDVPGYISAIRFYKSELNTGTHVGSLWNSDGQLLAQAIFNNETESGWQQVDFNEPIPVKANTQYVASYHTETGYYSFDTNYFFSDGYSNGLLNVLSHSITGGSAVYKYGVGGFPTENWLLRSNYWVDVVFMTTVNP